MSNNVNIITPVLTGRSSQGSLQNSGHTFNESGQTFNEVGVTFGGFYGYSDVAPILSVASSKLPHISIAYTHRPMISGRDSQGSLENNGYTFNQAGQTFNEAGVTFGGFYGVSDVLPAVSRVFSDYRKHYVKGRIAEAGMPIGLLLALTYNERRVLT